jgi:hypothetical protein
MIQLGTIYVDVLTGCCSGTLAIVELWAHRRDADTRAAGTDSNKRRKGVPRLCQSVLMKQAASSPCLMRDLKI